jgi:hypothetical protein
MKRKKGLVRQAAMLIALTTFPLALGQAALAQDNVIQEEDRTEFQKKTVIDFSDVNIEGELTKPEGSYIKNRKRTKFRNLIQLRGNFRPELSRSVEAL